MSQKLLQMFKQVGKYFLSHVVVFCSVYTICNNFDWKKGSSSILLKLNLTKLYMECFDVQKYQQIG